MEEWEDGALVPLVFTVDAPAKQEPSAQGYPTRHSHDQWTVKTKIKEEEPTMLQKGQIANAPVNEDPAPQTQVPAAPSEPAAPKPKKVVTGICLYCGAQTKGGRFCPGHDSKMKSELIAAFKAGDMNAKAKLLEHKWADEAYFANYEAKLAAKEQAAKAKAEAKLAAQEPKQGAPAPTDV